MSCWPLLMHREAGRTMGGLVWSALGSSPVGCVPPGQSFNLSEPQFLRLQIQTKNTAEGGWPLEHGNVERGRQGEAGGQPAGGLLGSELKWQICLRSDSIT